MFKGMTSVVIQNIQCHGKVEVSEIFDFPKLKRSVKLIMAEYSLVQNQIFQTTRCNLGFLSRQAWFQNECQNQDIPRKCYLQCQKRAFNDEDFGFIAASKY